MDDSNSLVALAVLKSIVSGEMKLEILKRGLSGTHELFVPPMKLCSVRRNWPEDTKFRESKGYYEIV